MLFRTLWGGGVKWDNPDDIDIDVLPNQFVLKCNHDSGSVCICKDKSNFDVSFAKEKLRLALKRNFYWGGREWAYKNVVPYIFAEQYMEDESHEELKDYKVFCFNGKAHFVQVDFGRFSQHGRNCYDLDWNYLNVEYNYPTNSSVAIKKPEKLEEMISLAEKLAEGFPFVRVDFYSINDKLYFGEMTFYPEAGQAWFKPKEWDVRFGALLELPKNGK